MVLCQRFEKDRLGTALMTHVVAAYHAAQHEAGCREPLRVRQGWAFQAVAIDGACRVRLALNRYGTSTSNHWKPGSELPADAAPLAVDYLGRFGALRGHDLAWAAESLPHNILIRAQLRGPGDRRVQ
jgi:hypothetical protein